MSEQVNVLVVDDERFWRENYEESISGLAINSIRTVDNLIDARQTIEDMKFAAAIVDIGLDTSDETNVDGLLVMEKLRSVDDGTSIVVITGRSGSDVIDVVSKSIRDYKAVATFAKGKVDPGLLREAVLEGIQIHASEMAHRRRPTHREIPLLIDQMVWEDSMMRALGISEGISVLHDLIERLLRGYLPLIGAEENSSLNPDPEARLAHGAYWSRSIGKPILVSLGRRAVIDEVIDATTPGLLYDRYEIGQILADSNMGKLRGTVHELKNYGRAQFSRVHVQR